MANGFKFKKHWSRGEKTLVVSLAAGLMYSFILHPGHINFTISTEIVESNELCGDQKGFVPEKGQSDTLIKPVLVKVSFLQAQFQR